MIDFSYVGQYLYTPPNGNQLTFNFSNVPQEYFTSTSHYQYLPVGRTNVVLPIKPSVTGIAEGRSSNFNWNGIISQYISNTRSNNFNWIRDTTPPAYTYISIDGEPYANNVTLGLHMDGNNNGTTFTDITGNYTLTPNGCITSATDKKFGISSLYLNGSSWLSIPGTALTSLGTDNFTIEMWIKVISSASYHGILVNRSGSHIVIDLYAGSFNLYIEGLGFNSTSATLKNNDWSHLALTRNNNYNTVWIDGVVATTQNAAPINYSTLTINDLRLGRDASWHGINAYIDDFRITKGVARYTSNFTVPTGAFLYLDDVVQPSYNLFNSSIDKAPTLSTSTNTSKQYSPTSRILSKDSNNRTNNFNYNRSSYNLFNNLIDKTPNFNWIREKPAPTYTYITIPADPYFNNVVLGMHMEGTNNGTIFNDICNHTFYAYNSNTVTSTNIYKFGTSSLFIGDSSGLYSESSSDFIIGTNDFTIEFWVHPTDIGSYQGWFSLGDYNSLMIRSADALTTQVFINGSLYYCYHNILFNNTWYHIALTRLNGDIKLFINGNQVSSTITNSGNIQATTVVLGLGAGTPQWLRGYIDDVRVTKGIARYTTNFAIPTQSFPNSASEMSSTSVRPSYNLFNNSETKTAINTSGTRSINLTAPTRTQGFNSAKPETHCIRN